MLSLGFQEIILTTCDFSKETMAGFDSSKAYAEQEDVYFNDGREVELQRFVCSRPSLEKLKGSPQEVLAAIDEFGRQRKYLMNIGSEKGAIVADLIASLKPKIMVSEPDIESLVQISSH